MKATGIVRRIDDLGRVVIPKEIRRTQLIRVGDPLEIFVSGAGEVIFKKYSPIGELSAFAASYAEVLYKAAARPSPLRTGTAWWLRPEQRGTPLKDLSLPFIPAR